MLSFRLGSVVAINVRNVNTQSCSSNITFLPSFLHMVHPSLAAAKLIPFFLQFSDVFNSLGFHDNRDYQNMKSHIRKDTRNICPRIFGDCAEIPVQERDLESSFDLEWNFPCLKLVGEHGDNLSPHYDGTKDHIESSGISCTTLKLMQRERRIYDEE